MVRAPAIRILTRPDIAAPQERVRLHMLLLAGCAAMIGTGLVISTWLNLSLANYAAWHTVHVVCAIVTLLTAVLKVCLHEGWIVSVGRRMFAPPPAQPRNVPQRGPDAPLRQPAVQSMNRRAFLRMMGVVGIASVLAFSQAVQSLGAASDTQPDSTTSVSSTTGLSNDSGAASVPSSSSTTACTARCNRGQSGGCPFPGQCHNYQDSNGNGHCDLGECG